MTEIISIVNQKGGVGKTTTCINLAAAIATTGKKVLIIDIDPQGNASTGFNFDYRKQRHSIYSLLIGKSGIEETILKTMLKSADIITSTVNLSAADIEIAQLKHWQFILKNILADIHSQYDYIMIDCPPSLGILTVNALTASNTVIIPMQCEFFALEGLSHLLKTISLIKNNLNGNLKIEGVLLTMYDKRNNLCEKVEEDVRSHLKNLVYKTVIPRNIRLSEASSHGKPAILYDYKCAGSQAYIRLTGEILKKHRTESKQSKIEQQS